jgi:hypothetical protein
VSDEIKRTGPPTTRNGVEWEIVLSGEPTPGWIQLFRQHPAEVASVAVPQGVFFRGRIALFRASEDQVEHWVRSIDQWIVTANARSDELLDEKRRRRAQLESTHDKERIGQLNDRFKDL